MDEYANANLEKLLDTVGYSVLCFRNDASLTFLYASDPFYKSLGYEKGEIKALNEPEQNPVLNMDTRVDWEKVKDEIKRNGYAQPELKLIKKDGHHIWIAFRTGLRRQSDGSECFCGIANDITLTRHSLRVQQEQVKELEALTANVPGGVLNYNDDPFLTLNFISNGFCRITDYTREEISAQFGDHFIELVYPKDRGIIMQKNECGFRRKDTSELTYRVVCKGGRIIWVLDKARRIADCNGNTLVYSVVIDITGRKKAEDELTASEERYCLILDHMTDPVCDFDLKYKRNYCSPAFVKKFGNICPEQGDFELMLSSSQFVYAPDKNRMLENLDRLLRGDTGCDSEYRLLCSDGHYIWCSIHASVYFDSQGMPARLITFLSDIDRQKKENAVLRQKAEHDLMTGLYNRVTATTMVDEALAQSKPGDRHALFVVDIDNFKKVNDQLGHLCGDQLIVHTAAEIRRQFREDDIVGRVGGDEFIVFLKYVDSQTIVKKAEILQKIFKSLGKSTLTEYPVSVSVGVSMYPIDGKTYEELFEKADISLYAAKNNGKNSYRIYTKGIESIAHSGK